MRSPKEVGQILRAESAPDKRIRTLAALLSTESGLGTRGLLVVGGSAIEIYTGGAYVSSDIDILVADRKPAERVLKRWGFKDEGKLWTHPELGLFVDLMQRENTGSQRLTRVVQTEYGALRLGAPEDLIIKRLRETRFWSQPAALAQAILLAQQYGADLDWEYINFYAKADQLADLVIEVKKRAGLD